MQWIDCQLDEVKGLCCKTERLSMQSGVKKYGDEGKKSALKEMKNLVVKNDCFGEVEYESLTEEMKKRSLLLLMFMVLSRGE